MLFASFLINIPLWFEHMKQRNEEGDVFVDNASVHLSQVNSEREGERRGM